MLEALNAKINNMQTHREVETTRLTIATWHRSFGCTSERLRSRRNGEQMAAGGLVRSNNLAFPEKAVKHLAENAEKILVPEMNSTIVHECRVPATQKCCAEQDRGGS